MQLGFVLPIFCSTFVQNKKIMQKMKRKIKTSALVIFGLLMVTIVLFVFIPNSQNKIKDCACRVDAKSCYELIFNEKDTLYVSLCNDSLQMASTLPADVDTMVSQSGVFVSNEGDVLTSDGLALGYSYTLSQKEVNERLCALDSIMALHKKLYQKEIDEFDYYARKHTVIDDGYNEVLSRREEVLQRVARTDSAIAILKRALQHKTMPKVSIKMQASITTPTTAQPIPAHLQAHDSGLMLIQSDSLCLPMGAQRFSVYRFGARAMRMRLLAFNDWGSQCLNSQAEFIDPKNDTIYAAAEGGAYVNRSGHLCGIRRGSERVGSFMIAHFLWKVHCWPVWWKHNLFPHHSGASAQKNTLKSSAEVWRMVSLSLPDSVIYKGQTNGKKVNYQRAMREGYGVLFFADGTKIEGVWHNDSLKQGKRMDSQGMYVGQLDSVGQAQGQGVMYCANGDYYQGEWLAGKRHGFGLALYQRIGLHCGEWKENQFMGERMVYTADRVYGIDISRHQHEKDGKKFTINWNDLRITSLGTGRRVHGTVNYPVSYMYIKSTEGRTVYNKYYATDLQQARKRGIAVGTYHFFSTTSSGAQQAAHFLKMSWIGANDLPPVLDIEPTDAQINKMGGDVALFREVLVWLRTVERKCGKRPVLYVGQRFVNEHLAKAPAAVRNYDTWIARYSEFKPFVRLQHWQLTPYGRVNGIKGEVDVNVFNGSREDFREYLKSCRKN